MHEKGSSIDVRDKKHIQYDFELAHIPRVWTELQERFGFNLILWKKKFAEYLKKQPRTVSEIEAFIYFGNKAINPVINEILCRQSQFPSFTRLLEYVMNK
jgi:hypothetical protein